jgi:hypothetical protein
MAEVFRIIAGGLTVLELIVKVVNFTLMAEAVARIIENGIFVCTAAQFSQLYFL